MKNDFMMAINQVCHERQLPIDIVLEAVEVALISAYKRNYSGRNHVTAQIDQKSGEPLIYVEKAVVEDVEDENNEITLKEARKYNAFAEVEGLVSIESTPANFGRIAAQTAKQVILQRIREAERDALYNTYAEREGEIVNGTVHKIEPHQVTLSLGKVEAYLPRSEQIPTERYAEGQRLRAYVASVTKANRGPHITISRTHRNMLRRLLEVEVPEIYNGTVEIKSIAREAGYRSKVAVAALQEGVDPVGSCVGMRGTRIQNIVNELNGEKIDVVQWNPDLSFFIANSLSPAKVMNVMLHDEKGKTAEVVVPDKQLSLAIGKEGQNARLAAKLTNWRIDIKSASEATQEAIKKVKEVAFVRNRVKEKMDIFRVASMILSQKDPLEFNEIDLNALSEAVEAVNLAEMALARQRKAREAAGEEVKDKAGDILAEAEAILSGQAPKTQEEELEELDLEFDEGDEDEEALDFDLEDAFELDEVLVAAVEVLGKGKSSDISPAEVLALPQEEEESEPEADEEEADEKVEEETSDDLIAEAEALLSQPEEKEEADQKEEKKEGEKKEEEKKEPAIDLENISEDWYEEVDETDEEARRRERRKARRKKRRLVYDEKLGEVIAARRRKRNRRDWTDYNEEDI